LRGTLSALAHFSKKAGFFTASGKGFFQTTKPLILLAETIVKYSNVKYVLLTQGPKAGVLSTWWRRAVGRQSAMNFRNP
jgi:hypothetical protein